MQPNVIGFVELEYFKMHSTLSTVITVVLEDLLNHYIVDRLICNIDK